MNTDGSINRLGYRTLYKESNFREDLNSRILEKNFIHYIVI
ncbi:hypothetical protein J2Y40_000444 [Chryseobacterium sp. 2987]|nr:hypothetical protein [Chryseobacterium sp. 2987]